jgi:ABC-type nitrate/sulfonate/bicarbonate transport system ATPase subunit
MEVDEMSEAAMRQENKAVRPAQSDAAALDAAVAEGGVRVESGSQSLGTGAKRRLILDDASLSIKRGEFVSLIGPSGCGKSTLLKIVAGLHTPDRGRVLIHGETPDGATRDKSIGLVPQDPALLPWRSVLSNVQFPVRLTAKPTHPGSTRTGRGAAGHGAWRCAETLSA